MAKGSSSHRNVGRALQFGILVVAILAVVGLFYSFHLFGDETLCSDRQSLHRKIADLQQQLRAREVPRVGYPGSQKRDVVTSVKKLPSTPQRENFGNSEGRDSPLPVALESREMEELMFLRNTRYWLETKPEWPRDPIPPTDRYVTFDPWRGGFNNIRMSLEMAFAAAFALNRTLVMPPKFNMYLRGTSALEDYFDLDAIKRAIPTLTYEEFAERLKLPKVSASGSSTSIYFKSVLSRPGTMVHGNDYWKGKIASEVVYCVPHCPESSKLRGSNEKDKYKVRFFDSFAQRMYRRNADDSETVKAEILHFPKNLLGHFYTMFWFDDPQQGRRMKRLVRDHVHFKESLFEMAERIIKKLGDFKYSCLHIRRNEFQFKDAWTSAEDILENTKHLFKPGENIYIATDEVSSGKDKADNWHDPLAMAKNKAHSWFKPMMDVWGHDNVHFLNEFYAELEAAGLKKIHVGCIESIVCSRARVFVGTRKSTFSGYIHRMRGYMHDVGQKEILDAQTKYPDGYYKPLVGPTWGTLTPGSFEATHPYWGREYKEAWENVYNPIF